MRAKLFCSTPPRRCAARRLEPGRENLAADNSRCDRLHVDCWQGSLRWTKGCDYRLVLTCLHRSPLDLSSPPRRPGLLKVPEPSPPPSRESFWSHVISISSPADCQIWSLFFPTETFGKLLARSSMKKKKITEAELTQPEHVRMKLTNCFASFFNLEQDPIVRNSVYTV